MMDERHARTRLLVGDEGMARLLAARVAVVGLGGVGGHALEAIARAGVGHVIAVDFDRVEPSNLNRQILATEFTMGRSKTAAAEDRVHAINPACQVTAHKIRLTPDNVSCLLDDRPGFVIDAIDDVPAKAWLLATLHEHGIPCVACMGAGGLADPTGIRVEDISQTKECPLARAVRLRLRKLGIGQGIPCVYSPRPRTRAATPPPAEGRRPQGTLSYMPGLIGLTAAAVALRHILGAESTDRLIE